MEGPVLRRDIKSGEKVHYDFSHGYFEYEMVEILIHGRFVTANSSISDGKHMLTSCVWPHAKSHLPFGAVACSCFRECSSCAPVLPLLSLVDCPNLWLQGFSSRLKGNLAQAALAFP